MTNTNEFSDRDFRFAVTASSLAYESGNINHLDTDQRTIESQFASLKKFSDEKKELTSINDGKDVIIKPFFKGTDKEPAGYVIYTGKEVTISFRGTDNWDRVKSDLNATQISEKNQSKTRDNVGHHTGFDNAFEDLKTPLIKTLNEMYAEHPESKETPVTFTGHSYGGAIAQIAAKYFATVAGGLKIDTNRIKVITFGAPRVFSTLAALAYNKLLGNSTIHFQNDGDIVPGVPPKPMYEHTGRKIIFKNEVSGHSNDLVYKTKIVSGEELTIKDSKSLELNDANKLKNYRSISNTFFRGVARAINSITSTFSLSKSQDIRSTLVSRSQSIDIGSTFSTSSQFLNKTKDRSNSI